jgi:hypothetical protein
VCHKSHVCMWYMTRMSTVLSRAQRRLPVVCGAEASLVIIVTHLNRYAHTLLNRERLRSLAKTTCPKNSLDPADAQSV